MRGIAILVAGLLLPGLALAQGLRERAFYPADGGSGCFLRQHDAAHMASHPGQQVKTIALGRTEYQPEDPRVIVRVMAMTRAGQYLTGMASCGGEGDRMMCHMEGDAGRFSLSAGRDGALRMDIAPEGISFAGDQGAYTIDGSAGGDRSFLLPPVPADACP